MELRHLRYFVAVADELSFTRAAQRLRIAQPPLSQQIRDLEQELGFRLFERDRRSVRLTSDGSDFLPEAKQILDAVAKTEERARLRAQGEFGKINVALISALATPRFASLLRNFQKSYPGARVALTERPSLWQLEALQRGEIDVGFLRPTAVMPAGLESRLLRRAPMTLAVPRGHAFARLPRVVWKDLDQESLICVEPAIVSPDYYASFFALCRAAGVEPKVQQYASNVATQVWLVSAGLGLAPMPLSPDWDRSLGVTLVALPSNAPVFETALVWRKNDASPLVHRFIERVGSEASK